jgi:predicted pyridoxine 5'-phosphate oxidase superfamily flavin-nucleotide-binding protein
LAAGKPTRHGVEVKRIALSATEIDLVERARPGHVATATADGAPHVSPKGTVRVLDGGARIGFAHIHCHRTIANLATNPAMVVSVVDVIQRRGLLIYGNAKVHTSETAGFAEAAADYVRRRGHAPAGAQAFVVAEVTGWEPSLSPAYDTGALTETVEATWREFYAGQHPRLDG